MGLRQKKDIGVKSNFKKRDFYKKYIFVFEGEKTEKQYFDGIYNNREELGINSLIYMEFLDKEDESRSNQLDVVESMDSYIKDILKMQIDGQKIKDAIINIINSNKNLEQETKMEISQLVNSYNLQDNSQKILYDLIDDIRSELNGLKMDSEHLINELSRLKQRLDYDKSIDKVCIIIDRDKGSFKKKQYDRVVQICKTENYDLGISNPCFEFWLLLHLCTASDYDKQEILNNKKQSKRKTFVEKKLAENLQGSYNKSNLKFDQFKDNIKNAIKNYKLYETDIEKLKDNIGTRVGVILEEMIV